MTGTTGRHELVSKVNAVIEKHGMIRSGDGIVVGVSGGPDSVALLHVMNLLKSERNFRLVVAHLDHGLRPESREDAEFTWELSESLGVSAHVQTADVRQIALDLGISVEEAGRRARYDFYERVRAAVSAQSIATAHHLDDQLETFFLRVFRGSTLTGLGGIYPKRGRIIRPFIEAQRTEILDFLSKGRIPYRIDRSNLAANTDRNFIRNRLMPMITERFPDFRGPLTRTVNAVRDEEDFLESLAADLRTRTIRRQGNRMIMDILGIREAPRVLATRAVLGSLYELSGPSVRWARVHLDTIFNIVDGENPSAETHLPGGIVLLREYGRITLASGRPEDPVPFHLEITEPGELRVPSTGVIMRFEIVEPGVNIPRGSPGSREAYFDAQRARFPLTVRSLLPGDRFRPWGMKGTRKLKNVLIDVKVPRRLRLQIPLLVKDKEILWISGIRRGRAAPVVQQTQRVLKVTVQGIPF